MNHPALRLLLAVALLIFMPACGSNEDDFTLNTAELETDATEAVVLRLLSEAESAITAPTNFPVALILGEIAPGQDPAGTSDTFKNRFASNSHPFVSADELVLNPDTKATVVQKTTTIPLLIQIISIRQDPSGTTVDAAWNYGRDAVAKRFLVTESNGQFTISEIAVLRDNRKPIAPADVSP